MNRNLLDEADVLVTEPSTFGSVGVPIGASREDRPILGTRLGHGPIHVSLIGGCHADEPVGPEFLRRLAVYLTRLPSENPAKTEFSWWIVPHVNPDGEERNRGWSEHVVDLDDHLGQADIGYEAACYFENVVRELPGDDVEFGFPENSREIRPENVAVARFLRGAGQLALHGSFHGMGLATGVWFLLEPSWDARTPKLRERLAGLAQKMGYPVLNWDREGEKGFRAISPGFSTRPDSKAMKEHFLSQGDPETAAKFRPSSMEFARSLGGDPLTLVTEMPLFLVGDHGPEYVPPPDFKKLKDSLAAAAVGGRAKLETSLRDLGVQPMSIRDQMRLQLAYLNEALCAVRRNAD